MLKINHLMINYKKKPDTEKKIKKILHPVVAKWFFRKFKNFSLPQLYGVMEIHQRQNILVSAPTGATKTLTGFLSILNELVDSADKGILENKVYCVYVSPLKALNNDISRNLLEPLKEIEELYGKELGIRVGVRTGDTTQKEKAQMLKKPPHILITTPESLAIMLTSPKFSEHLKDVSWIIIDEIHALADGKRGVHLSLSIERLDKLSSHMTRIGLSATVAPLDEIAKFLVGYENRGLRPCKIVDVQFIKELDIKVLSPVDDLINTPHEVMHYKMYKLIDKLVQKNKTTLIFTNTRAATERVVDNLKHKFPKNYNNLNIAAHHGSLSKEHRQETEQALKDGKLKCVVCSTSLELGIDIGYIDLVLLLGSPKSVARALQRVGRSGHKLHAITKGRIIVLDRDDLVECACLLKNAMEKKIDKIHIPTLCLDVLAQQILGIILSGSMNIMELYEMVKKSYCYHGLPYDDFLQTIEFLAGEFSSLEARHVYGKIYYNRDTGEIRRRGKMTRVIYMTNIGTIPDQTGIKVKIGDRIIGVIGEGFLEKLRPGDVFVLGGNTYIFKHSRGMVAQVSVSVGRPPTVPHWVSEMLPLSFDLANDIGRFRRLIEDKFKHKKPKKEIMKFINDYLYVDSKAAKAIFNYLREQYDYIDDIASDKKIVIENYSDNNRYYVIFQTMFGRRVNDCLSRAVAYAIARTQKLNVEIGINDNGFYVASEKKLNALKEFKMLKSEELVGVMNLAIDKTEVFKRRFRHCAARALMILRFYMGRKKTVGRAQVSSMLLMHALRRIDENFTILKEAKREVLEDLMDIDNAKKVLSRIEQGKAQIKEATTQIPSPFAFKLIADSYTDIMKIEDKIEFLRRMHSLVIAKIALQKGKKKEDIEFSLPSVKSEDVVDSYEMEMEAIQKLSAKKLRMVRELDIEKKIPLDVKLDLLRVIKNKKDMDTDVADSIKKHEAVIRNFWSKDLAEFILKKAYDVIDYRKVWDEDIEDHYQQEKEVTTKLLVDQMLKVQKKLEMQPEIFYDFERLIEGHREGFGKKFLKYFKELMSDRKLSNVWPKELREFLMSIDL